VRGDARLVEAGLKEVLAEDMFQEARQGPLRNGANKVLSLTCTGSALTHDVS
jgi:hypothetical protein